MQYDFDRIIERRNTGSVKYDAARDRGYPEGVLPLWIADMDFQAPAPVLEALHKAVDHGIFGYSMEGAGYYEAVSAWFLKRFGWQTRPEWLVTTPGVVYALATAVRALTDPGDAVLLQPPVYHPFFSVIRDNGRRVAENALICKDGRYTVDFADFERRLAEEKVKLFLLCSPHNPVGRVWTEEELRRMGELCRKYGVTVVSDEIHCDFAFEEHPHHVFLKVNPELAEQTVLCTAPSKTFNLAGLHTSNIWIPGRELRERFRAEIQRGGGSGPNRLGLAACQAAYAYGEEWLDQCRAYLRANLDYLREFLRGRLPQIRLVEPEGTYFAWLDFSALGLERKALNDFLIHRAGLWLNDGRIFGENGEQFQRMALACPRAVLEEAMHRLERAVTGREQ